MNNHKTIFLIGQTASGKEKLSLKLAEFLKTDIISMDSMKIYKDMNIGTAKPPIEALSKINHHMIDIIEPTHSFTANEYYQSVSTILNSTIEKGLTPYFSGGTALYAKILQDGMFTLPEIPKSIRFRLEAEWDSGNQKLLYQQFKSQDPKSAEKIHENDKLRVIRALEVYEHCGQPISSLQSQFKAQSENKHLKLIGIRRPRKELHERIELRVKWMIEAGLIDEVKNILLKYNLLGKAPSMAVGYNEIIKYLNGTLSKDDAIERIIINTRQLCKHQMTWFRKFPIDWIDADNGTKDTTIIEKAKQLSYEFLNEKI